MDDCISSSAQMFTHALPNGKLHNEDDDKFWTYSQQDLIGLTQFVKR